MTSRTGSAASRGGGSSAGRGPAFTLVELLVVIMIIAVLAGIVVPVMSRAKEKANKEWANKEVYEFASVLSLYHQDHNAYPPDTGDWVNYDFVPYDEYCIHAYFGREITNKSGRTYKEYRGVDHDRLINVRDDGIGIFVDPFGTPYQIDAVHMIPPGTELDSGDVTKWTPCGWPYLLEEGDVDGDGEPTLTKKREMVHDFKVVSFGPDSASAEFPFDPDPGDPGVEDDIRSW
jgi:prepilin-type N-terminal cleavage/methylation domain-containing protein